MLEFESRAPGCSRIGSLEFGEGYPEATDKLRVLQVGLFRGAFVTKQLAVEERVRH